MKSRSWFSKSRLSVFVVVFAAVALFALYQAFAAPKTSNQAILYVSPASLKVSSGNTLAIEIWMDAKSQPVNAVQANLSYPADKFDFSSVDNSGSAFEVAAQSDGGNGSIKIARGHVGSLSGKQLVTRVNLVAKSGTGKGNATINFTSGSVIVRSTDNVNVLSGTTGGRYSFAFLMNSVVNRNVYSLSKRLLAL
jgi:hypothetical protein